MFLKEMLFRYNCEGTGTEKKIENRPTQRKMGVDESTNNPIMAEKEN